MHATAEQAELFTCDPWGLKNPIGRVQAPCPGIARAVIAPLCLGQEPNEDPIVCLAVSADGQRVAIDACPQSAYMDGRAWARFRAKLRIDPFAIEGSVAGVDKALLSDSLANWLSPWVFKLPMDENTPWPPALRAWYRLHQPWAGEPAVDNETQNENAAMQLLRNHLYDAVVWALNALEPRMRQLLWQRPTLSIHLARHLLCLAQAHGADAPKYTWQALATEPLGLLHCLARQHPRAGAQHLRTSLFEGRSLPQALSAMGVLWAGHRLTLVKASSPGNEASLSEWLRSEDSYFSAQHLLAMLPHHLWPRTPAQQKQFFGLTLYVLDADPPSQQLLTLIEWTLTWSKDHDVCERLKKLISEAVAIVRWTPVSKLKREDYLAVAVELTRYVKKIDHQDNSNWSGLAVQMSSHQCHAHILAKLMGVSLNEVVAPLFRVFARIEDSYKVGEFQFTLLKSLDEVLTLGAELGNCLAGTNFALDYVINGRALFQVHWRNRVVAVAAIDVDVERITPEASYSVLEIGSKIKSHKRRVNDAAHLLLPMLKLSLQRA